MPAASSTPAFHERLGVPLRWWAQGTMLVAALWLALVVAVPGVVAWSATALALLAMVAMLTSYGSVTLRVDEGAFHAGRARIEGHHLGRAEALDPEHTRRTAGRDADARAYLLLRPYLRRAVKVEILDTGDPAPYWLVSTRRPDELAAALAALVAASQRPTTG